MVTAFVFLLEGKQIYSIHMYSVFMQPGFYLHFLELAFFYGRVRGKKVIPSIPSTLFHSSTVSGWQVLVVPWRKLIASTKSGSHSDFCGHSKLGTRKNHWFQTTSYFFWRRIGGYSDTKHEIRNIIQERLMMSRG